MSARLSRYAASAVDTLVMLDYKAIAVCLTSALQACANSLFWSHLQVMGKNKVLVKVHPEGKYVVDLDKDIDIAQARSPFIAESYQLCVCIQIV
jgi:hypothetical protein